MKVALRKALICMGALCSPAVPAETPTFDFECDTPVGHFSQWKAAHDASTVRIRGIIKVRELRRADEWVPGAHIYVYGADRKMLMGLILGADHDDPAKIRARVLGPASKQFGEAFASMTWKDASIAFEVNIGSPGVLNFSVDGTTQSITAPNFVPSAIGLRCTSGDFFFGGIEVTP